MEVRTGQERVGLHQGLDTAGDISPLGVQGDELAGQVGQDRPGRVGAGEGYRLLVQGVADLLGPGGMAAGSVLVQPGIDACLAGLLQCGGGGPGRYGLQDGVVLQEGSQDSLEGGVDLGVQAPNAVGGLVDLACQVQVETSQHAQGCSVLIRSADSSQGVRHGAGGLGDHGCVTGVGLGVSWAQVCDAAHRQSRQAAHCDTHILGHRDSQGPDGRGLIHDHQHTAVLRQMLVQVP